MATAIDTPRGKVMFFEDFLYDVATDKPEYSVGTDPAVEIVATGENGVVRVTMEAGQSNIDGMSFGQTQWYVDEGTLIYEARVKLSALGTASERLFVGFTDVQEDTLTEMPFTGATTVLTPVTNPTDCIGFFWEGDMTNPVWTPASQNTDALVVDGTLMTATAQNVAQPVAGTYQTLRIEIGPGGFVATFYVDGQEVYRHENTATPVVAAATALTPYFVVTEGTTAINFDVDYIYVEGARAA